jgi:type III secretory pathway lipoprotein EscJ
VPPTADEMRLLECSDNDVEGVFRQIEGQVSALVATVDDDDDDRDSDEDDEDDE